MNSFQLQLTWFCFGLFGVGLRWGLHRERLEMCSVRAAVVLLYLRTELSLR